MMKFPQHNIPGNMSNPAPYTVALTKILSELGQEQFLNHLEQLNSKSQQDIYNQLLAIDKATFLNQINLIKYGEAPSKAILKPYTSILYSGNNQSVKRGQDLIRQGKVGCLIVAGGQATRFGIEGPKGAFPISNVRNKSLFQIFFEKCGAAGAVAGRELPIAIMTSPLNHNETQSFIEQNNYFGLSKNQVDLFQQHMLPFLNERGQLFLEDENTIAQGPDGNGSSLKCFVESGLANKWRQNGVEFIIYILIDNPLADPYDAELVGTLSLTHADAIIKCTDRRHKDEKVGVIVEANGTPKVIEYFELPPEATSWSDLYANISLFAFSLDFVEKVSQQEMPLHKAFKPTKALDAPTGVLTAWKFEKFIFDVLDKADRVNVLHYPREQCFAPLKNKEGTDSPVEVRAALLARDRQIYREATGLAPPDHPIELSQQFYYPTPELLSRWKNKQPGNLNYLD